MCSGGSDWTCLQPGFPIRKSSDHSLVIDSPRLIADSYVLLRFLVPRHPPCALKNLATNKRCSRPLCSSQHTGGPPSSGVAPALHTCWLSSGKGVVRPRGGVLTGVYRSRRSRAHRPSLQDPTTCQALPPAAAFHSPR